LIQTIKSGGKKKEKAPKAPKVEVAEAAPSPAASAPAPASPSSDKKPETPTAVVPPSPRKREAHNWTVADVGAWMKEEGFSDYTVQFEKNLIDGQALLKLNNDTLKELGMELVGVKIK